MNEAITEVDRLAELLRASQRAVVFSGAGISTESGIPDYRGPGGLWTKIKPTLFQDFVSSEAVRRDTWQRWFEHGRGMLQVQPNAGHFAVAGLVNRGRVSAVITQNVDNLHQDSGVDPRHIIELHGNATYAKCLDCGTRIEMDILEREFTETGNVGPCRDCGGLVKSATVSFGQMMPEAPMLLATEKTLACDLFIVLGSSLSVYPAAGFPAMAVDNGATLVIVNQQPTDLDVAAELVIRSGIGATLQAAVERLD